MRVVGVLRYLSCLIAVTSALSAFWLLRVIAGTGRVRKGEVAEELQVELAESPTGQATDQGGQQACFHGERVYAKLRIRGPGHGHHRGAVYS